MSDSEPLQYGDPLEYVTDDSDKQGEEKLCEKVKR